MIIFELDAGVKEPEKISTFFGSCCPNTIFRPLYSRLEEARLTINQSIKQVCGFVARPRFLGLDSYLNVDLSLIGLPTKTMSQKEIVGQLLTQPR